MYVTRDSVQLINWTSEAYVDEPRCSHKNNNNKKKNTKKPLKVFLSNT